LTFLPRFDNLLAHFDRETTWGGFSMKRWMLLTGVLVSMLLVGGAAPGAGGGTRSRVSLDMYTATVSAAKYRQLLSRGIDVASAERAGKRVRLDLVLTRGQASALRAKGVRTTLIRNSKGLTVRQAAAVQAQGGYVVWRDYDSKNGLRDELYKIAADNPGFTKLEVIGHSNEGREILALKLTQDAQSVADGARPAVLYSATQHAREWIAPEVDRRNLRWFVGEYNAGNPQIRNLLSTTELWFVLVMNPDGYQFTFQSPGTRLWRKNTREQNGVPGTQVGDGVDPNRNYPAHWDYDREGSSSIESSDTYRGPEAASEPETQAIMGLFERVPFKFQVNYHSYGPWLLYPQGWQIGTPTADDPIFYALSGNRDNPAIPDFVPGLSSDVLYVTNGEMTDYANSTAGTIAWTPELEPGCPTCGFVFPDDPNLVQKEWKKQLPFVLDVAKSALDPAHPVSHLGLSTRPLLVKSDDTYKAGLPTSNFTFDYSYGDPQEVRVDALKSLGPVSVKYRINGGDVQTAPTSEWAGGDRYTAESHTYYHVLRGFVTGTSPGDSVQVWFEGGGATSDSFTYQAVNETNHDTLVVASEDYTGASPVQPGSGPHYLSYYLDALAANGVPADVYDVDARGRKAADALGVLSHYKAVIVYKGDDVVTREPGWGGGNASRIAQDEMFELREFMNEGGRAMYAGKNAGLQYSQAQLYDPTAANGRCGDAAVGYRCLQLNGTGDGVNDVLQYWFGSYLVNLNAGRDAEGNIFDAFGTDTPFDGVETWSFNGEDSAQNHNTANSFIATSGILPAGEYPQFESSVAAKYDRPGGPFDPHSGTHYAYSQIADQSFKRLTHTVNVPASGADMSFWVSYNTEQDWDMVFVEEHTVGQDDWTTLQDVSGNDYTTQSTGESCKPENGPGGWRTIHPFMDHYQTIVDDDCIPEGTTGEWWAANGTSGDWQNWQVDLAGPNGRFLGHEVEVSITYVSDWATQGLGVFVDDIDVSTGEGTTSFESGDDGWATPAAPAGSATNANTWEITTAGGFPEGAAIAGPDSLLWGFGLEGVTDAARREELMGRAVDYLLR
jgi:Zinc carboxypeptidase